MKLRSVNTKFWDDSFIVELDPHGKLLFIYLLTNPLTSTLGVYEITIKRICFDIGLTPERVSKALEAFEKHGKVYYKNNLIVLPNFIKNQSMNPNMIKGAINSYNDLPMHYKPEGYTEDIKDFESLRKALKAFGNINIKLNTKDKDKDKPKDQNEVDLVFPFETENFKKYWKIWKEYKKTDHQFKYKSITSEQAALKKLGEMSGTSEETAIKIIMQSIENGWKGFFNLKNNNNGGSNNLQGRNWAEFDAIVDSAFGKK